MIFSVVKALHYISKLCIYWQNLLVSIWGN